MIICAQCGHDNQPGRLFCAQCGGKLDLQNITSQKEPREPCSFGGKLVRILFLLLCLVVILVVLACIPRETQRQEASREDLRQARKKLALLEARDLLAPQSFSEVEINACLAEALSTRSSSGSYKIQWVQARLLPNAIILTTRGLWNPSLPGGYQPSLVITRELTLVPEVDNNGLTFFVSRGKQGHLPLPGPLTAVILPAVKKSFKGWRADYPMLSWVRKYELEEGKLTIYCGK